MLLSFYGDDFTGSTDVMEALCLGGVRTVLYLDAAELKRWREDFPGVEAVGLAGTSRAMTPAQMKAELPGVFQILRDTGAAICHYKTCSTFDSAPEIGSIGKAIDLGQDVFPSPFVPLVVGAPVLKRYCVFGNLFATVGEETFRLDRHPTMSRHPVTPMNEGDLRRHLARQTEKRTVLFDILHLTGEFAGVQKRFAELLQSQPEIVLFDVLDDARLSVVGRLIWEARGDAPQFVAGSSGVEYALTSHWRASCQITADSVVTSPGEVEQILVAAGSCSPTTKKQIDWCVTRGYAAVRLDASRLAGGDGAGREREAVIKEVTTHLSANRSAIIYTALGPDDPRISAAMINDPRRREQLGDELGIILRALLERTALRRVVVAGGDTSGYVSRRLGIYALEMLKPIAPGSPLCRAFSRRVEFNHLEIAMKGGQVGGEDYFEKVRMG